MCKLILLSNTKNSSINESQVGNKIYIKVKRPRALCGHHDHRTVWNDRGTDSSFSTRCLLEKTLSVHHLWSVMVIRCNTTPNRLGFETDREPGRSNNAVKNNWGLKDTSNVRGGNQSKQHRMVMKNYPPLTYHQTG